MRKLYVFGDSFAAPNNESSSWAQLLADRLKIPKFMNFGINGSSSEYAMHKFHQTISEENVSDSIIIVLLSTIGRLDLEFQIERPETAVIYLNSNPMDPINIVAGSKHEWYRENKKHIEWLCVNSNRRTAYLNRECYIHALKNYAESDPGNMVIVLQNSLQSNGIPSFIPRGILPSNFIAPEIDIDIVSKAEIINYNSYHEFVKYTGWDPRINHLTNPNLEIMAESLYQMILTRDINKLQYDSFRKNIIKQIKNQQQLDEYITAGILYPNIVPRIK